MTKDYLPVIKSFIAEQTLSNEIEAAYGLSAVRCQLITATMRDVYLVTSHQERYIFYIYGHNQRTPTEISAEWQFIDYLYANGVPVAPAVATKSGDYMLSIPAPEGIRYGVLTVFVAGEHLRKRPSIEAVRSYGQLIGQIHVLADEMPFELARPVNDVEIIVSQSIAAFEAEVFDRSEDAAYLHQCAAILLPKIKYLPQEKPFYGMIHGDVIRANAQVGDDGTVTVLDFDLCGLGWRAYDIASYLIVIRGLPEEVEAERAFLDGYQEVRPLTKIEQDMLPVFEAIRAIFSIGVPALNVYHWGSAYLHTYLDNTLDCLRDVMGNVR